MSRLQKTTGGVAGQTSNVDALNKRITDTVCQSECVCVNVTGYDWTECRVTGIKFICLHECSIVKFLLSF